MVIPGICLCINLFALLICILLDSRTLLWVLLAGVGSALLIALCWWIGSSLLVQLSHQFSHLIGC
jgi:hypothetical protein